MASIRVWKCDLCGNEFRENDPKFETKRTMEIFIQKPTEFDETLNYKFVDTCSTCREKVISVIDKVISEIAND